MKIIKPGNVKPPPVKRFGGTCPECGCVFDCLFCVVGINELHNRIP